jgi:hypothetical protein
LTLHSRRHDDRARLGQNPGLNSGASPKISLFFAPSATFLENVILEQLAPCLRGPLAPFGVPGSASFERCSP